jgi:hypothetical protein
MAAPSTSGHSWPPRHNAEENRKKARPRKLSARAESRGSRHPGVTEAA